MFERLTRTYLDAVDQALPGFVDGLYIVGSAALGAWQPAHSDVDTIIFTSRAPTPADLAVLERVHTGMPAKPHLDGVYVEPALARSWPGRMPEAPFVVDGILQTGKRCGELTPVVWLTLQRYGIAVRGPAVTDLGVEVDPAELRRYNLDNLRSYWQSHAAGFPAALAEMRPGQEFDPALVTWFVLGPARLHYTLAHADIVAKPAAGAYLAEQFPQYTGLARRAVAWRSGAPEVFTAADLSAAGESVHAIADDAWRRWG